MSDPECDAPSEGLAQHVTMPASVGAVLTSRVPYLVSKGGADVRYSSYDVLVIGGGIAGLTAATGAARRWNVGLITKGSLEETTTFLAQGGIAAAMGPYDSTQLHLADTLEAGAGLCDDQAVRVLVEEGPERVRELERLGTQVRQSRRQTHPWLRGGRIRCLGWSMPGATPRAV